jgi:Tol biopolymer transport system component
MPEVQEVFRMATNKVKPDPNALERQLRRQRTSARSSRMRAYIAAAAVLVAIAVGLGVLTRLGNPQGPAPGDTGSQTPTTLPAGVSPQTTEIVDLRGRVVTGIPGFPHDAMSLSMTADGSTIAFVTTPDGSYENQVAIIGADGTGMRVLATPGLDVPLNLGGAAISPDGTKLAFAAEADGNTDIYVIGSDGSGLVRLTTDDVPDQFPQWSPDSATIVYDNVGQNVADDPEFSKSSDIWSVPADGGTPASVARIPGNDNAPSYSPDGSQIAFFHDGEIWVMGSDGLRPHRLLDGPGGFTPRWSPDGTKIAYTVYDDTYRPQVAMAGSYREQPLVRLEVVDLTTGRNSVRSKVTMASDYNTPVWLPTGDQLLIRRVPPTAP